MKVSYLALPSALALCCFPSWTMAADTVPYQKHGVVNCALPGTTINFALNGSGGAEIADVSTNFPPLREAANVRTWAATERVDGDLKLLILDNLSLTRIMIRLPDGQGVAYVGEDGASDILCQVLVQPD